MIKLNRKIKKIINIKFTKFEIGLKNTINWYLKDNFNEIYKKKIQIKIL